MAKSQRPSLSDLGALRDQLKAQAIERERAAEQARQDAARAALEANLFRASVEIGRAHV